MANKKLLYILPEYNKDLDGHIFYLVNFVAEVAKKVDVFVIIEKSHEQAVTIPHITGAYVQKCSSLFFRSAELFFVVLWQRLRGYKTAYIHYSYIGAIVASIVLRLSGGRTYYWNCGMMRLFGKNTLLKIALHAVNYLVTGVHALKAWYAQEYGISQEKILIMPNRVELERLQDPTYDKAAKRADLGLSPTDKVVLFVHRLAPRKGIQYVTQIAKYFLERPDVKFVVIGDGPYRETFLQEIKDWKLTNITYIGKVPNREVYRYFLLADLFLMPSEEEGFPRVLIESMACNIPYVASDIGGVKEISPEWQQSYIYPIGDVPGFVSGITQLLAWEKSHDYKTYVQQFDIAPVTKHFISLCIWMKENLSNIYEYHHTHRRPAKFSIFEKERGQVIEQLMAGRTGLDILDIGCRDGNLTKYFNPQHNNVIGIDIDRMAMAEAEKLGITTKFEDLNGEWDFLGDKKFDIVGAFEIVEHLYYPDVVVGKVHKALKPHGVFVGSVPNGFSLPNRVRLFMGKKRGTSLMDPTHINHFTYEELYQTLSKHFRKVTIYGLVAPKWMPLAKRCPSLFSFMFARRCEK